MSRDGGGSDPDATRARYEEMLREILRDLLAGHEVRDTHELRLLADRAYGRIAQRGVLELRQALAELSIHVQRVPAEPGADGNVSVPAAALKGAKEALGRALGVVSVLLEREHVVRALIPLRPEEFDLRPHWERLLEGRGLRATGSPARFDLESAPVHGDPAKITEVLDHLLRRFGEPTPPGARLVGHLRRTPEGAEGFVGVQPAVVPASVLVQELTAAVASDRRGMDTPFARAIIERHGGELSVARTDDGAIGLRFALPGARPPRPDCHADKAVARTAQHAAAPGVAPARPAPPGGGGGAS